MTVDLDKILNDAVDRLIPWDLSLTIQGKTYAVRPVEVGDLAAIADPKSLGDRFYPFVEGLFVGDNKPPVRDLPATYLTGILAGVLGHFEGWAAKNSQAVATAVRAATARKE